MYLKKDQVPGVFEPKPQVIFEEQTYRNMVPIWTFQTLLRDLEQFLHLKKYKCQNCMDLASGAIHSLEKRQVLEILDLVSGGLPAFQKVPSLRTDFYHIKFFHTNFFNCTWKCGTLLNFLDIIQEFGISCMLILWLSRDAQGFGLFNFLFFFKHTNGSTQCIDI